MGAIVFATDIGLTKKQVESLGKILTVQDAENLETEGGYVKLQLTLKNRRSF